MAQAYTNLANASIERNQPDSARYWVNLGLRAVERYQPENHLLRAFLLVNDALLDYQAQNSPRLWPRSPKWNACAARR